MRSLFILVSFVVFISACEDTREEWSDHQASEYAGKEILKDVQISYSDSGQITIIITAPEMIRFTDASDTKEEFPKGFFAKFYNRQHELENTLSSKYAMRIAKDRKTIMQDSVVFQSVKNETLKTAELIWDEGQGKLYTEKYVRISRNDELIHGYGFETDENFKTGKVKSIDAIIPSEKLIDKDILE